MRLRSTATNSNSKTKNDREVKTIDSDSEVANTTPNDAITSKPVVNDESRLRKVLVRTGMGCCMVIFYCSMLRGGYMYCILVGVLTQVQPLCTVLLLLLLIQILGLE
jgi:hypothetical protein